ncbi:hypothetical protein [Aestuariivirga sp.]|uniref:hypothetical protein n=1 Tax=Aestuariivirga sp. TaxID=2650926 RepID=UPI00391AE4A0
MLKLVAVGIWMILVTAGATFGSVYLATAPDGETPTDSADQGVEELKSEMTSIPVVRGGEIAGYLILQLSFASDRRLLEEKKLDPMPFMKDAAFRVVFSSSDIDFRRLSGTDLEKITAAIAQEANSRIGAELVRSVLLQQLNYVRKEDIRTNWINGGKVSE